MIGNIAAGLFGVGVTPSTTSYESIATVSVGSGGSSSIDFTSISSSYKHLQLRLIARGGIGSSNSSYINLNLNNDSSGVYAAHQLFGDGSSASANAFTSQNTIYTNRIGGGTTGSSGFGAVVIDLLDYTSTSKYKTIRALGGFDDNGSGRMAMTSGLYQSTSAINRITLTPEAGSFPQYSHFALYGIKD